MALNITEMMLLQLGEEATEVAQEASKCIRFTLENGYNGDSNIDRLRKEYSQFMAVIHYLVHCGVVIEVDQKHFDDKLKQIDKYLKISKDLGCLDV